MYSRRLASSTRALSQLRQRVVQRELNKGILFPLGSATHPQYSYYQSAQSPAHNLLYVRHFSSDIDKSDEKDKDKDKEKNKTVGSHKKVAKTDYKKMVMDMVRSGAHSTFLFFRHPTQIPMKLRYTWSVVKEEAHHYYLGFKLLSADVRTAKDIIFRILEGHSMTRRERLQLMRTVSDLARLVPFSVFILIPFMELLLPVAIKMFPNMLPSTFEDSLKKEENMKNELNMRLSVASFFIDTIKTMAEQKKKKTKGKKDDEEASEDNASATELIEFMEKARMGEPLPHEAVVRIARLFKDELTLANMPRPQLVTMCQFMNLQPYGSDTFLRFQLRTKLNSIKEDDKRILWEGVDSLSALELQEACRERGMRATGLNTFGYRKQIKEWLELSMLKHTPISLLIMSRAFVLNLSAENRQLRYEESLQTSISSMDEDVVNEVIVQSASAKEVNTAEMKKRKLESLQFQNEMIQEELEMEKEFKRKEKESLRAQEEDDKEKEEEGEKEDVDVRIDAKADGEVLVDDGTPSVIGIGDKRRVVDSEEHFIESSKDTSATIEMPFDKEFIRMAEGAKFEGDVLSDIAKTEPETPLVPRTEAETLAALEEMAEAEKGAPLTASEVQALGDMALQSAVEREKMELFKLKNQIKDLKLEKKAKKDDAKKEEEAGASVDNAEVLAKFDKEMREESLAAQQGSEGFDREVSPDIQEPDFVQHEPTPDLREVSKLDTVDVEDHKESEAVPDVDQLETSEKVEELAGEEVKTHTEEEERTPEEEEEEDEEEEDVSLLRMKSLIDGMMTRLEDRLTKTESVLGDKLHKLDVDRDGVLDNDELQAAVMQLLRRHATSKDERSSQEAADLIELLDQDKDGRSVF